MILDVMMPGMDGFGVLRRLRADGIDAPALFLTARDSLQDKIAGLTLGGDDYVTKPFSLEEVVARLRVILRRAGKGGDGTRNARLTFADIELDEDTHEVWKAGDPVSLSPTEFTLLRYFVINAGTVLSKPKILDHVGATTSAATSTSSSPMCRICVARSTPGRSGCCTPCAGWAMCFGSHAEHALSQSAKVAVGGEEYGNGHTRSAWIAAAGGPGRGDPGVGGLWSAGLGRRGHVDPAAQSDHPDRPDAARRIPRLGAGPAAAVDGLVLRRSGPGRPPSKFYVRGISTDGTAVYGHQ